MRNTIIRYKKCGKKVVRDPYMFFKCSDYLLSITGIKHYIQSHYIFYCIKKYPLKLKPRKIKTKTIFF